MQVQVQVLEGAGEATRFQKIAEDLQARRPVEFQFDYQTDEGPQMYRELLEPRPTLVIVGGGHVGQSLARIAYELDFEVTIIDDRVEYTSPQRFPTATQRITGDIATELSKIATDHLTYIVIVTRGHNHDGQALEAVVRSNAKYIGLIGSKRKIAKIYGELAVRGVTLEQLQRVHAPIGLEINSISVPEIAVSIAGELVAVRRGCADNEVGTPMKLTADEVERIFRRSGSA
jgi:xanthine dehydrogenase accessory factor